MRRSRSRTSGRCWRTFSPARSSPPATAAGVRVRNERRKALPHLRHAGEANRSKTELEYGNPFQLVIAVLLSAQTTDKSVNAATRFSRS